MHRRPEKVAAGFLTFAHCHVGRSETSRIILFAVYDAIACEKKLKGWRRSKKIARIKQTNPRWLDLSDDWDQQPKFYDRSWDTTEMIRGSSLRSE
jgi:hypothetical protein